MTPRLPFPQPHPLRAGAELSALRAAGPIHRVTTVVGDPAWLVTGYTAVRELMDDVSYAHTGTHNQLTMHKVVS